MNKEEKPVIVEISEIVKTAADRLNNTVYYEDREIAVELRRASALLVQLGGQHERLGELETLVRSAIDLVPGHEQRWHEEATETLLRMK